MVVVVDDLEKGIIEGNFIVYEGNGQGCKHLEGNKSGEYSCAIHHYPWFPETPCGRHGQIEQGNTNCRLGEYILTEETQRKEETSYGKTETDIR